MLNDIAVWIGNSQLRELSIWMLGNVPGLPPILQTIHILAISAVMGSIVIVDLRVLGLAVPSQHINEMVLRLRYWTLGGVLFSFFSGVWFVLARPNRYFFNPVFQIKFSLLIPALLLTFFFYWVTLREENYWSETIRRRIVGRALAFLSLLLWLGVVMAGRWIAYSEYLFWSE